MGKRTNLIESENGKKEDIYNYFREEPMSYIEELMSYIHDQYKSQTRTDF